MRKKFITSLVCLLVIIVFNFALPRLMPGDTVLMLVGMDEDMVSEEQYKYYADKTGAKRPVLEQFWDYSSGIAKGDLGYSYHYNQKITDLIAERLPNTLQIAVPSIIISSLSAIVLGCLMGMRKDSIIEHTVTNLLIVADAIPSFMLGLLLIAVFAFKLRWLPMGSFNSIRVQNGVIPAFMDRVKHLVLPVTALVIGSTPSKYLIVCNLAAKQKNEKYVLYARSRGLSDNQIVFKHIFPNICQTFITMVGMNVGFIVSGSLVIETIFSIKGMGSLISQAITARDYPVLQGCLFVSALVIVTVNLLTDLLCVAIDPKVRCKVHEAE
ncbi:MAG: ABC transporter permease [Candidatus Metalachnospira sp.]|nr:ABC transporter permease [Candidatus Metalachnospira sp.]